MPRQREHLGLTQSPCPARAQDITTIAPHFLLLPLGSNTLSITKTSVIPTQGLIRISGVQFFRGHLWESPTGAHSRKVMRVPRCPYKAYGRGSYSINTQH